MTKFVMKLKVNDGKIFKMMINCKMFTYLSATVDPLSKMEIKQQWKNVFKFSSQQTGLLLHSSGAPMGLKVTNCHLVSLNSYDLSNFLFLQQENSHLEKQNLGLFLNFKSAKCPESGKEKNQKSGIEEKEVDQLNMLKLKIHQTL